MIDLKEPAELVDRSFQKTIGNSSNHGAIDEEDCQTTD
jgi:hypothetical protein